MKGTDSKGLLGWLQAVLQGPDYDRLLRGRFFMATVSATKTVGGVAQASVIRVGETTSDGNYLPVLGAYWPQVGDVVECFWRDPALAYIIDVISPAKARRLTIIQSITTSAGLSSVTFKAIPSTFTDLEITYYGVRDNGAGVGVGDILLRFNGDGAASFYLDQEVFFSAATVTASESLVGALTGMRIGVSVNGGTAAGQTSKGEILIPGYTDNVANIKSAIWRCSARYASTTGTIRYYEGHGTWFGGSIISQIDILSAAASWAAGGVFTLRGK